MTINLQKGQNVSLTENYPELRKLRIGLGWNERDTDKKAAFDLDAAAFLLGVDHKVRSDADFIFYNQLRSSCGSVIHAGDERTGAGAGDKEILWVQLDQAPAEIAKIVFTVTIHEAKRRWQHFGMVQNAYIRLYDDDSGKELLRYNISDDASLAIAMIFGELYRHGGGWRFRAVGQGFADGLKVLAQNFGVNIG